MSKPYGLIVPNKEKSKSIIQRPSIFNDDDDDDDDDLDDSKTNHQKQLSGLKRPLKKQDKINQNRALEQDPTVYQYDEIYDEMDKKRKESKLLRKDLERKPKYINKLLETAERRKKENERRIERQIQKERDAEGEQYKDKESFVTSAYRKKLEEMKQMDELEKREEYLETIGDVTKQQNLDGFYRHLYQQKVNYNDDDDDVDDNNDNSDNDKNDKKQENIKKNQQFKQRQYRKRDNSNNSDIEPDNHDNDNSDNNKNDEIDNKKEHLPSNLDADSDFSIDSSSDDDDDDVDKETNKISTDNNDDNIKQEKIDDDDNSDKQNDTLNKTNNIVDNDKKVDGTDVKKEEITVEPATPPPVKKTKVDIWKKRTIGDVYQAALQRYFERKALREL